MRYVLARKGKWPVSQAVETQLLYENKKGLHLKATYEVFRGKCEESRTNLVNILKKYLIAILLQIFLK